MKKLILFFAFIAITIVACQDNSDDTTSNNDSVLIDMSDFFVDTSNNDIAFRSTEDSKQDKCYTMKVLNQQLKENPSLEKKMYDIEYHTRQYIAAKGNNGKGKPGGGGGTDPVPFNGSITIPVYVHVIYSNANQNISDAQINSQIIVLNNDFNDSDYSNIPAEFQPFGANTNIHFTLNSANIARHADSKTSWGTNNAVKLAYPPVAGYLNFWICNIGGDILGYAQFPGGSPSTDGIVIGPEFFGSSAIAPGYYSAPYDKGRTATHEVGHWLNLRHIWGDGRCRQDDFVADTPSSAGPNYGCPSYPTASCRENEMTMNYMDYTYDDCMNMFTLGQNDRMRAIFASGGARESFVK